MTSIRIVRSAGMTVTPWKNGGGETRQVAVHPPGAGMEDFGWRVSLARVDTPGPFSSFPEVDRTLAVVEGAGLRLHVDDREAALLDAGSAPFRFPGDIPVSATLDGAPVVDFNVMTHRARFRHFLTRARIDGATRIERHGAVLLIHALDGPVSLGADALDAGDAAICEGRAAAVSASARDARLMLAYFWPSA
ncbi:HutD family protein [Arenibaculum sp.]|jgi:hypothetical protein|uniref:HutD/Ves family protein n=1 Tax=Arenibaculum sp. TaxID=2865862 RepID=UPI002E109214|nr:HutD family protein [Arenibaculum sp.]